MRVAHRRTLCLGELQIPVCLHTAINDSSIHFNQLHKDTKERIQYAKICPHCDGEVKPEDIIRVYEYTKDRYVTISNEEIEQCKMEKDKTIQVLQFSDSSEIDPIYYDTPYYITPDVGGEKAFELLRVAMLENRNAAIAKTILGKKEILVEIVPKKSGMLMRALIYAEDVKDPPAYIRAVIDKEELAVFKELVILMTKPFEHASFHDEYNIRVKEIVEEKILAQNIIVANEKAPQLPYMDAIKKNILGGNDLVKRRKKAKSKDENKVAADYDVTPNEYKK